MAQIFVAVLGASSFTFAHASWTQALPDRIDAHVRALAAIGGVPQSDKGPVGMKLLRPQVALAGQASNDAL